MRENLPFDDFVKKQFSDYSPEVPAHIWENIIAARRTRPKGFWFPGGKLLLGALLLISAGAGYYLISGKNSQPAQVNNKEKTSVIKTELPKTTSPSKDQERRDQQLQNPDQQISNIPVDNNEDKNDASLNDQKSNDPSFNNSGQHNYITRHPQGNNSNVLFSDQTKNRNNKNITDIESNNSSDQPSREVIVNKMNSPFGFSNARELNTKRTAAVPFVKLPECPVEQNAAANKTYWEVYGGPDYAFENYKSYGDTASANYLEKRKASQKFSSAFSAGVRYTKVFNNGTSVRAGVNYTQVNEKFQYFNPNEIKYITVITTRVVIRAPGDTIYINDTLQYQQTGTRIKTTINRYRNIDVPLVIGYELGNGRIHANINAGVIINIYSWYKGDVLDSLYQPVTITTGKGNSIYQFKNNIGVGFLGSVSLYYKMTDKLHLVIEPYFRYNLSPISKQNLNLQQKYNIGGIRAGVRFDLK